jgi:hypothetical protein
VCNISTRWKLVTLCDICVFDVCFDCHDEDGLTLMYANLAKRINELLVSEREFVIEIGDINLWPIDVLGDANAEIYFQH